MVINLTIIKQIPDRSTKPVLDEYGWYGYGYDVLDGYSSWKILMST